MKWWLLGAPIVTGVSSKRSLGTPIENSGREQLPVKGGDAAGGQYPIRGGRASKDQGNPYRSKGPGEGLEQKTLSLQLTVVFLHS